MWSMGLCVKGIWGRSRKPKGNRDFEERVEPNGGRVGAHTEREEIDTSGRMCRSVLAVLGSGGSPEEEGSVCMQRQQPRHISQAVYPSFEGGRHRSVVFVNFF